MLPRANRIVLKYLVEFLHRVSLKREINKMGPENIAIVFCPNLLKPMGDDLMVQMLDTEYSSKLMVLFISEFGKIFKVWNDNLFFLSFLDWKLMSSLCYTFSMNQIQLLQVELMLLYQELIDGVVLGLLVMKIQKFLEQWYLMLQNLLKLLVHFHFNYLFK